MYKTSQDMEIDHDQVLAQDEVIEEHLPQVPQVIYGLAISVFRAKFGGDHDV